MDELIYFVKKEIFMNISSKDLPVKSSKKKRKYRRVRIALKNLRGTSIEKRPVHKKSGFCKAIKLAI